MVVETGPGVRFPPPLVFVLGMVAAWYLNRILTFEIDGAGPGWVQIGLGVALVAAGLALTVWAVVTLRRAATTVRPDRPAARLVTNGPYRRTRNPIYLGFTVAYAGLAVLLNWAWPLVLLPVVLITLTVVVVQREEQYLHAEFDAYEDYSKRVRRWL